MKNFKLNPEDIATIAVGLGTCLATDRIVVDGMSVGYMYRENPVNDIDSGWRFFCGDENGAYMSDNSLHGVYDVNTILNYDPTIINYLSAPYGSAFERTDGGFLIVENE